MGNFEKFVKVKIYDSVGKKLRKEIDGILRIETEKEINYVKKGNILNHVLNELSTN